MRIADPPAQDWHAEIEALLRDTDLTMTEIGARTGVSPRAVSAWNARFIRRLPRRSSRSSPASWPAARREALARLHREVRVDPGDLAEVAGVARSAADALFRACGLVGRPARDAPSRTERLGADPLDAAAVADAPTLRASLRAHIARQIAAFDAALRGEGAAVLDSARVLRDLGGLKRLFDELVREDPAEGGEDGEPDLPAIRAELVRHFERFVGGRASP